MRADASGCMSQTPFRRLTSRIDRVWKQGGHEQYLKALVVAGARPDFIKVAPVLRALSVMFWLTFRERHAVGRSS